MISEIVTHDFIMLACLALASVTFYFVDKF